MEQSDRAIAGESYSSHERKETAPTGRSCSFPGCLTKLSIYNPKDRCSLHLRSKINVPKAKRRRAKGS